METTAGVDCSVLAECAAMFANDDINGDHADDATWILTSSFVILTMQSGFGLLEMGCAQPGNEVNIMMKNVVDVVFGALAYWTVGYGISYGLPSIPFMGLGDFFLHESYDTSASGLQFSHYIFQFSFAATATTIVSGCVAMRMRFLVYCIFSFFSVIIYSFVAHWVWAEDGWLKNIGFYDFAGGGPVHLLGGINGLIAIIMVGSRTGRFDGSREKMEFQPSSPTTLLFGLFMLWWGWIGFNCGSTFGITGNKWVVASRAAIVTINSTAGGGLMSILYSLVRTKGRFVTVDDLVAGILGSLVSTSPTCSVIHTYDALIIGAVGSLVAILGNRKMIRLKLDDPVGNVGVHAGSAIWGLLAVGLFADASLPGIDVRDGLFRGRDFTLLGIQCLGIITIIAWAGACSAIIFYIIGVLNSRNFRDPRSGLRVTLEEEMEGADKFVHCVEFDVQYRRDSMSLEACEAYQVGAGSSKKFSVKQPTQCVQDKQEETDGTDDFEENPKLPDIESGKKSEWKDSKHTSRKKHDGIKPIIGKLSSDVPSTSVPSTSAPSTKTSGTSAPSTGPPSTSAPSTTTSGTSAPSTSAPSTSSPSTSAPSTSAPSTSSPSTSSPSTSSPSTSSPSTSAPSTSRRDLLSNTPNSSKRDLLSRPSTPNSSRRNLMLKSRHRQSTTFLR